MDRETDINDYKLSEAFGTLIIYLFVDIFSHTGGVLGQTLGVDHSVEQESSNF